jgi:hypothetical protein
MKSIYDIADEIIKAYESAQPYEWATWDSFAGRQVCHKEPIRDARKKAIVAVIQDNRLSIIQCT